MIAQPPDDVQWIRTVIQCVIIRCDFHNISLKLHDVSVSDT